MILATGVMHERATRKDEKTTTPVKASLETRYLSKNSLNSSRSPVMTHSSPPMALSMPRKISITKKSTDHTWDAGRVAMASG